MNRRRACDAKPITLTFSCCPFVRHHRIVQPVREFVSLYTGKMELVCLESGGVVENRPLRHKSAECTICLDELQSGDKSIITVVCCNNQFHSACYMNFMTIKQECPLCRAKFATFQWPERATPVIGEAFIHPHRVNVTERAVFAFRKRQNLIFVAALGFGILYLTLSWDGP